MRLRPGEGERERRGKPAGVREIYGHPAFRLPFLRRFSAVTLAPFWILYREAAEQRSTRAPDATRPSTWRRPGAWG